MPFHIASFSLIVALAFIASPCAAQESDAGSSVRPLGLPQQSRLPQPESGAASSVRPLDLSVRRSMLPTQAPHAVAQGEDGRLGKAIAATAVRPCISPAYREVYQLPTVPLSQQPTSATDAAGNTPFVAASAVWLMTQAVGGACRS